MTGHTDMRAVAAAAASGDAKAQLAIEVRKTSCSIMHELQTGWATNHAILPSGMLHCLSGLATQADKQRRFPCKQACKLYVKLLHHAGLRPQRAQVPGCLPSGAAG
jgi:hypothetical protein